MSNVFLEKQHERSKEWRCRTFIVGWHHSRVGQGNEGRLFGQAHSHLPTQRSNYEFRFDGWAGRQEVANDVHLALLRLQIMTHHNLERKKLFRKKAKKSHPLAPHCRRYCWFPWTWQTPYPPSTGLEPRAFASNFDIPTKEEQENQARKKEGKSSTSDVNRFFNRFFNFLFEPTAAARPKSPSLADMSLIFWAVFPVK